MYTLVKAHVSVSHAHASMITPTGAYKKKRKKTNRETNSHLKLNCLISNKSTIGNTEQENLRPKTRVMSCLFEAWKPVSGARVTGIIKMAVCIYQFQVFRCENVVLDICNVPGEKQ